jgi:Uma2 family endonuclease
MIAEITIEKQQKSVPKRYTLEEYFELEEKSISKNQFINGKIIPTTDQTIDHNILSGTVYAFLLMSFFNTENELTIYNSSQKIYTNHYKSIIYADACAVIGKTETYQNGNQAILNPTLIVEVASESTEKHDRSVKFRMYQSLPSFKEYVLVSQTMPIVEVFYKIEDNKWQMISYIGLDKIVKLETLDVELKMSDIYKKITDLKDPQMDIEFPEEEKKDV